MTRVFADLDKLLTFSAPVMFLITCVVAWFVFGRKRGAGVWSLIVSFAVLAGYAGYQMIEPIPPGGWGFGGLLIPFLVLKWGSGVLCLVIAWHYANRVDETADRGARPVVVWSCIAFVYLLSPLLGSTLFKGSYVNSQRQQHLDFWSAVVQTGTSNLPMETYQAHLTNDGKAYVQRVINETAEDVSRYPNARLDAPMLGLFHRLGFRVGMHPAIGPDGAMALYEDLLQGKDPSGGFGLASNRSLPAGIYHRLAKRPNLLGTLLNNPAAPLDLYLERHAKLLADVASGRDQRAALELLERKLAEHKDAPPDLLRRLSQSDDGGIDFILASNPNTPTDVLDALTKSSYQGTAANAKITLARSPATPLDRLKAFVTGRDRYLVRAVATNPALPDDQLISLLENRDSVARVNAADNLMTRGAGARAAVVAWIKKRAARDAELFRGASVSCNMVKDFYLELVKHPAINREAFECLVRHKAVKRKDLTAAIPYLSPDRKRAFAENLDSNWVLLQILSQDSDPALSAAATKSINTVRKRMGLD